MNFDDHKTMYDEIRSAIGFRMKHDEFADERIASVLGSAFLDGFAPSIESHENPGFEYVQNLLSATNFYNPVWNVSSDRPSVHRQLCDALRHTMNRWTQRIDLSKQMEPGAVDAAVGFSAFVTTLVPIRMGDPTSPTRPMVTRLPRKRYFRDPQAIDGRPAYEGHLWVKPISELAAEVGEDGMPLYDPEALSASVSRHDIDMLGGAAFEQLGVERVDRDEIIGGELWHRDTQKVYTFACDPKGGWSRLLCPPRDYFGPKWGPYTLGGFFFMPDQVYPFPPLANVQGLANELNAHIQQVTDQADQMRTVTLYNALNTKLGAVLKRAKHGSMNPVAGFDPSQLAQVTLDAPDPKTFDYIDRLRMRVDRKAGTTVNMAGTLTGATAQEVATVNAGDDSRRRQLQRGWNRVVSQVGKTAAWYFVHAWSVQQGISLPHPAMPKSGEMVDAMWYGGLEEGEDIDFDELEISVEPLSAEFVTSGVRQAQAQAALQIVTLALPMMVQFPFVNWRDLLADTLRAFDVDDVGKWVNFAMLEMMRQVPMSGDMSASDPGAMPGIIQPRASAMLPMGMPQGRMVGFAGSGARQPLLQSGSLAPRWGGATQAQPAGVY